MDWLKDTKNQPIVIGGAVALLVIAIIIIIMTSRSGNVTPPTLPPMPGMGSTGSVPGGMPSAGGASMPGMPPAVGGSSMPGMPPAVGGAGMPGMSPAGRGAGMPGMPGMGGPSAMPGMGGGAGMPGMGGASGMPTMGAAPAAPIAPAVAVIPVEKSRSDPFAPLGVKIPKSFASSLVPVLKPHISDFPVKRLFTTSSSATIEVQLVPDPVQPARRMAGILLNSRIFAILETNGKYEIVQPGDTLADRLASVERVERDRVILKTTGKRPRLITVRMAAGNRNTGGTGMPGNTRPGGGAAPVPGMGPGGGMMPGGMMPGGIPQGGAMMPGMPGMPGIPM